MYYLYDYYLVNEQHLLPKLLIIKLHHYKKLIQQDSSQKTGASIQNAPEVIRRFKNHFFSPQRPSQPFQLLNS